MTNSMTSAQQTLEAELPLLEQLSAVGEGAPTLDQKMELTQAMRGRSRERTAIIDRYLLERVATLTAGLLEAREHNREARALLENLTSPPWHPATLDRVFLTAAGPRALVVHNGVARVVNLSPDVDAASLACGDEVFLGTELNVIVSVSPYRSPRCGETARFERYTGDGRAVLKWRDEDVVVGLAAALLDLPLERGDVLRWDRSAWLAFEKIARADGEQFFLSELPSIGRDQLGGQDTNLATLLGALSATLVAPALAARYGLSGRTSILMWGPPGVGKTLMARIAAAEVTRLSGQRCRIAVVKPAEWESPWVGETQQNIRTCFAAAAREADAHGGFTVLFLDEIESVARIRGSGFGGHHSDKFLAALLAELDGFTQRANVAVIAATNRKDLVDPAALERLSDVEILVQRPDLRAARAIFRIHMAEAVPYSPNGADAAATREEIIETAVSRLYSPNGDNELCTLKFRDGKTRTIAARELASGRIFEQICRTARRAAFLRELRDGDAGMRVGDIEDAVADALERLTTTLSIRNAHAYISDLPTDVDVVNIEPILRRVKRRHRYAS
jgi:proteasome-associated ATPase